MNRLEAHIENEVKEIRNRLDVLERLVMGLIKIEPITEEDLTPQQRKLYKEVLSDIRKKDYSKFLTLDELKIKLKANH
ncbi:MAG TPA: hypothetical protein VIH03_08255 [Nitrososphaerales archaeon]